MRKILTILSTLVIASILLVACAQEETATVAPGTSVVPTDEQLMTETPIMTEEPMATETAAPMATETVMATEEGIPVTGAENLYLLSNQLDYDIWNDQNDQIGEVENMVIDLSSSQVDYVYIETGGFLDIGDTESLVPWNALELANNVDPDVLSSDDNVFILQVDQDMLQDVPDFDINNDLPAIGQPADDWDTDPNTYWQNTGVDMTAPDATVGNNELQGMILATDLLDANFGVDTNGDQVVDDVDFVDDMSVDNVIVDTDTGQVKFVVLDSTFDIGERLMPVSLNALRWDADSQTFLVNADQTTLEGAPYFDNNVYPDTFADGWDTQYYDYWQ